MLTKFSKEEEEEEDVYLLEKGFKYNI